MLVTERRSDQVIFYSISWQQFENILANLGETSSAKIAYDNGILEIMTPLPEHEYYKERISDTIKNAAEFLDLDFDCLGSTTWKRELKMAGVEADSCFYFQNEPLIRGKLQFDLNQDHPPDLALEIDLTSKSLQHLPIYASLGVPEICCYDLGELKVYQLQGEEYLEVKNSSVFPNLRVQEIPALIETYRYQGRRVFQRKVREWIKKQID